MSRNLYPKRNSYIKERGTIIMTKIKNTKKGMAKKTLSMSLVVAMLATSNVPVWAAEFSDGTDASVATEADAFAAEAPVVDDTEDAAPASVMVNEADITLNLSADSKKVVWGGASVISGTVTKTDGSEVEGGWQYRWVDEKGIAYASSNGKVDDAADMSLNTTADMAGKTLTLYVYDVDSNQQTLYDINTGISVAVEKRSLNSVTATPATTTKAYNGFAQTITEADGVALTVLDSENANVAADAYETSVTNATNNKEEFKLTVTAKEDQHIAVTADFGQNGRCADAGAGGVALHHRLCGHGQPVRDAVAVHKDEVRHDVQPFHGLTHPAHGGIQDIVAVDDVGADEDDLVSQCLFNDLVEKIRRLSNSKRVVYCRW